MKIAWVTPFSQDSAIGKYSQCITDELKNHCEIDLWVPGDELALLDTEVRVVPFKSDDIRIQRLKEYDCIVYNMGDHFGFHGNIYEVSKKVKGIVILHDFVMHHFFAVYYLSHLKDNNAYIKEMSRLYGVEGQRTAADSLSGKGQPIWETDDVVKYPFFEKAIEGSLGVIVHSRFLADEVKKTYLGPVATIYHPFYLDPANPPRPNGQASFSKFSNKVLMLTIGYINPNKRIDKVIKAIGENKSICSKVNYVIIGSYDHNGNYFSLLQALIIKYGLQDRVKFLGYQPDETLYGYLARADFCLNLRFPAMEGASWSLVEQLQFGKPVIVTDNGFYSELPDDCVVKIDPNREEEELTAMLNKLISNASFRDQIGRKGREFAIENFSSSKYCKNFLNFYEDVRGARPLLELTDRVGLELSIMKATENMETITAAANEIYQMFKSGKTK